MNHFIKIIDSGMFKSFYNSKLKRIDKVVEFYLHLLASGRFFAFIYHLIFKKIDMLTKQIFLFCYKRYLEFVARFLNRAALKNKIVFISYNGNGYGDNPKYICEEVLRQKLNIKLVWLVRAKRYDKKAFPEEVRLVNLNTAQAFLELFTAKIIVKNVRNYSLRKKRTGQYIIQTWHGAIGIKKSGADIHEAKRSRAWYRKVSNEALMNDLVLSDSPVYTEILKSSYFFNHDAEGMVIQTGHPRNDVFFCNNEEKKINLMKRLEIQRSSKLAIYAPTYRGEHDIFDDGIDFTELLEVLHEKFDGDWIMLIRYHPRCFKAASKIKFPKNCINVTWHDDMYELLSVADVGITDYSSWIYDYMLTHRPGFLYVKDENTYQKERGLYFAPEDTPFPVSHTFKELCASILDFDVNSYLKKLDMFILEKEIEEDGQASRRVVDLIKSHLLESSDSGESLSRA